MSSHSGYNSPPLKPSATVSPPFHPSSDGNSTTSHQSETPPLQLTLIDNNDTTPPLQQPSPPPPRRRSKTKTTSFPVRDDCWSEDATFTLIEAWGDRILKLNSGSLRQKHWLEVADAVNARHGHVKKSRRSDVQCKNRIDTLKKKYKVEKALVLGADRYVSPWPFFAPLDSLIGSGFKPTTQKAKRKRIRISSPPSLSLSLPPPPSSVPVGRRSKRPPPPVYQPSTDSSFFRRNFSVMAAAAAAIDGEEFDSDTSLSSGGNRNGNRICYRNRKVPVEKNDDVSLSSIDDPYQQLAEAIGKFADVYKRVEEAKQRQMIELEKQRMQFTKDLELERMKLLMESQVQLGSLKRLKSNSEPDLYRSDDSASMS